MQILMATTNAGKLRSARIQLNPLGIEVLSLSDLGLSIKDPEETLSDPVTLAAEKALYYADKYREMPVLARDDVTELLGVSEEDDPKNHLKEFVERRMGAYSDELGLKCFSELATKYGGEIPINFHWGFALAKWVDGELILRSLQVNLSAKLVSTPSQRLIPGFSIAPITVAKFRDTEMYDSEMTEDEQREAYSIQGTALKKLLGIS